MDLVLNSLIVLFLIGLVFGSFINVCIYRIPRKIFFKNKRSVCPKCDSVIRWYDNIPVISYIYLRGISRCCKKNIDLHYPIVEIFVSVYFVLLFYKFNFFYYSDNILIYDFNQFIRFLHIFLFISIMLICSVIDIKYMIIPNELSLGMILFAPVISILHPELNLFDSLIGVFLGGGIIYVINWLYWLIRNRIGIGMGDLKLLAAIGGWLGYQSIFSTMFYASILATIASLFVFLFNRTIDFNNKIPFGPFLAIGSILYFFI